MKPIKDVYEHKYCPNCINGVMTMHKNGVCLVCLHRAEVNWAKGK